MIRAITKADKEITRLIDEVRSRKWRMVADAMKNEKVRPDCEELLHCD